MTPTAYAIAALENNADVFDRWADCIAADSAATPKAGDGDRLNVLRTMADMNRRAAVGLMAGKLPQQSEAELHAGSEI